MQVRCTQWVYEDAIAGYSRCDAAMAALDQAGIEHEPLVEATDVRVVQLADPDDNRIVLTGAKV